MQPDLNAKLNFESIIFTVRLRTSVSVLLPKRLFTDCSLHMRATVLLHPSDVPLESKLAPSCEYLNIGEDLGIEVRPKTLSLPPYLFQENYGIGNLRSIEWEIWRVFGCPFPASNH